jgi:hypothetical protein
LYTKEVERLCDDTDYRDGCDFTDRVWSDMQLIT